VAAAWIEGYAIAVLMFLGGGIYLLSAVWQWPIADSLYNLIMWIMT
jgi:hypothetical protein